MSPKVDYDKVAGTYDRRFLINDYSGVERALVDFTGPGIDGRVLEVGCGTGHWLRFLAENGARVAGVDESARMLATAHAHDAGTALVRGVAEHLPWSDESFDRVFCVNALHHFTDKRGFLAEARRVLRRGGRLMTIGLDPHNRLDRWYVYDYFEASLQNDRARYLAASQIREWMGSVGFVDCVTREVQYSPVQLSARAAIEQGRLDKSASSQLNVLTDEQYERGMNRIREGIASAEAQGTSLALTADLRMYGTSGSLA
jgi:ubiquinone/menaquinone biosynthesis C-methylase UbiE